VCVCACESERERERERERESKQERETEAGRRTQSSFPAPPVERAGYEISVKGLSNTNLPAHRACTPTEAVSGKGRWLEGINN